MGPFSSVSPDRRAAYALAPALLRGTPAISSRTQGETMLKKIIFVSALAVASFVSFKIGGRGASVNVPAPAAACDMTCDWFGCHCP
jgi:hypothetical protein